ncbi:iron complex transport system substrate-binding protein [Ancylomarina subtilis]|uniref:Iron complex transport system substrate-binding protein n=2 Tax=Ancylomarina subtilis TaxID=1639035 RepID=A0A4Q7VH53_9BACT|nr:iron complex transport system substrate-binding protein [Ancylomarina subtilis]
MYKRSSMKWKMLMWQSCILSVVLLSLTACSEGASTWKKESCFEDDSITSDFKTKVKYARGFSINVKESYKEITVYNPWKNDVVLCKYILFPKGKPLPFFEAENVTYIQTPINSVAVFSNTHIGPLVELGLADKIVGITRANKIYNKRLSVKVKNGEIPSLGGAHNKNIDIEAIVDLNPELIILSAFNEVKSGESHLDQIGFKLAYALNWMEDTPLARAEWIKFVAAFFNKDKEADEFFNKVEGNYNEIRKLAEKVEKKASVLMGWSYKGIWYMPGGQNYMVSYLRDAGADYFLFADSTRGNIPMSVENVLDNCNDADIWIYPGICKSRQDIENAGEVFTQFKAFRDHEVYNIYKRSNARGGSDWWETATIRPDIVLKDFIKILHPEILPQDSTYFISKLH